MTNFLTAHTPQALHVWRTSLTRSLLGANAVESDHWSGPPQLVNLWWSGPVTVKRGDIVHTVLTPAGRVVEWVEGVVGL